MKNNVIGTLPGTIAERQGVVVIDLVDLDDDDYSPGCRFEQYQHQVPLLKHERIMLPVVRVQRSEKVSEMQMRANTSLSRITDAPAGEILAGLVARGAVSGSFAEFAESSAHISLRHDDQFMGFIFTATRLLALVSDDVSEAVFDLPEFEPV